MELLQQAHILVDKVDLEVEVDFLLILVDLEMSPLLVHHKEIVVEQDQQHQNILVVVEVVPEQLDVLQAQQLEVMEVQV
tara:strand:- start:152 stop:388 length:237 start_codon:yes stop_codon:yes gene_type:complete